MSATLRRIEELERRDEWIVAFEGIQRVICWAIETNQCTAAEGAIHLSEMKRMVPLALFVAGKWTPPHIEPAAGEATDEMMGMFHAWEQAQEIVS